MRRFALLVLALAVSGVLAACTFPDVDYADDDGGASGGGASCPAPPSCASDAASCASQAESKHKACTHQCKPSMPECPGACDQARDSALGVCEATCVSCASSACGSKPTNCAALVGL